MNASQLAFETYTALIMARVKAQVSGEAEEIKVGDYSLGVISPYGFIDLKLRGGNVDEEI